MKNARFARYAWGVLVLNLGVILWGAFVRASGSGAGCGSHWPLCNGEVVPRAAAVETVIELTHRTTSGIALIAVLAMFVWSRRAFPQGHPARRGAGLSVFFIILEALLGAGLVLFELVADDSSWFRAISMIAHLVNTFLLVGVLTLTAWWGSGRPDIQLRGRRRSTALIAIGAAGILLVGATGAIAALGDTLFPSATLSEGLRQSFSHDSHPLIQLRKFHPFAALLVAGGLVLIGRQLASGGDALTRTLSRRLAVVYGLQILAGTMNMVLLAPVAMQLVHLLLADLLWITFVMLAASSVRRATGANEPAADLSLVTAG